MFLGKSRSRDSTQEAFRSMAEHELTVFRNRAVVHDFGNCTVQIMLRTISFYGIFSLL